MNGRNLKWEFEHHVLHTGAELPAGVATYLVVAGALSAVAAGTTVAATALQAEAQADAAEYNAKVAEANAQTAAEAARYEAERIRERNRRIIGSQTAQFAKSGFELSGSAVSVQEDSLISGEMDALTVEREGLIAVNRLNASATLDRFGADSARVGGALGATAAGLQGASRTYSIANGRSGVTFGG